MDVAVIFDNFKRTITDHYFDFRGRTGRPQFWYFVLAYIVFAIIAAILGGLTFLPLSALYHLALLLPATGIGARRLQDTGRNGNIMWIYMIVALVAQIVTLITVLAAFAISWMSLILFGPLLGVLNLALLIGGVVLIWFWCQPGDPAPNEYGPVPPVFDPSPRPAV